MASFLLFWWQCWKFITPSWPARSSISLLIEITRTPSPPTRLFKLAWLHLTRTRDSTLPKQSSPDNACLSFHVLWHFSISSGPIPSSMAQSPGGGSSFGMVWGRQLYTAPLPPPYWPVRQTKEAGYFSVVQTLSASVQMPVWDSRPVFFFFFSPPFSSWPHVAIAL